ncbi:MAG: hypothetical protein LBT59_10310 [Clostridiales bacterium]|jgi:hypothetical protein|nr:hypothetical protein [Clostridiales bacterium]
MAIDHLSKARRTISDYLDKQKHRQSVSTEDPDPLAGFDHLADSMSEAISRLNGGNACKVEIVQCNTFAGETLIRHNYRLTFFGIIYDLSLTESLNALNLFYLHKASGADYKKYACKLLAEHFYNSDMPLDALQMIKPYYNERYTINNDFAASDEALARNYSAIQHCFILFHEIGHLFFKQGILHESNKEFIKGLLSRIVIESYKPIPRQDDERDRLLDIIENDNLLVEECSCDKYAIELLLHTIKGGETHCSAMDVAEAVFLALSFQKYRELVKGASMGMTIADASSASGISKASDISRISDISNVSTVSNVAMTYSLRESCARNLIPVLLYMDLKGLDLSGFFRKFTEAT